LHLAEVFERKLALMPFELSNPVWVDDDDVDLDYVASSCRNPAPSRSWSSTSRACIPA
jgi:diacylglycerol O-acyltransferase